MRILGLDIGSTSIKAVELDSAFGRYEIHEYHDFDLRKLEPDTTPSMALKRFLQTLPKTPDRVATALRMGQTTFRNLQLPTRDKKAILAGVGFELDDELPFAIEDAAFDHSILSQTKTGSYVHVAATPAKNLASALEMWQAGGADPDVVTTEPWAYRAFLNRVLSPSDQIYPVMLAQIGHERSTLYVHWNGAPVIARELVWGGRELTAAICKKYNLPWEQAEFIKIDNGFVVPDDRLAEVTQEQADFSATLMEPLQALVGEMRQAELACRNLIHFNVGRICLTGGTSQLPGLAKAIEASLRIPTAPIQALTSIAPTGVTYSEQADSRFLTASAVALCLVGPDRSGAINFRKGQFAKLGGGKALGLKALKRPIISAAIVSACLFFSLFVESKVYSSKLDDVNSQLEHSVRSLFGQLSSSALRTYMANPTSLRKRIQDDLKEQRELAKLSEPDASSPLSYLRELSSAIPKDVTLDLTQYQVDDRASLTFLVASPQTAERLALLLGPKLSELERGKMEETTVATEEGAPSEKRWKVTFSGKPVHDLGRE